MSGGAAVAGRVPGPRRRSFLPVVALVCVPALVAVVGARFEPPPHARWPALILVNLLVDVGFAVAVLLLWRESGQRRTALLLGLGALCRFFGAFQAPVPNPLSWLFVGVAPLFWLFAGWALLRYPFGEISRRSERVFLWAGALWLGVGHLVANLTLDPDWFPDRWPAGTWWPNVGHSPRLYHDSQVLLVCIDAPLALWYVVLVIRRVRRMSGVDRWILAPMVASIVAAMMPLLLRPPVYVLNSRKLQDMLTFAMNAALLLIPLAFIAVFVRQRITGAAIAEMLLRLGPTGTVPDVTHALQVALRDPTLRVLFWTGDTAGYVDGEGRRAEDPEPEEDRLLVDVRATDGAALAVLVTDPALAHHRTLVDAAVSASRLALENAALQAALQAQLEEVSASRRRIAEVGVEERRRLERDLHDGVQQRLIALTLRLAQMEADHVDSHAVIDRTRQELHAALAELRELARGIHPSVLAQSGLGPALEDVVDRLPFPVTLQVVRHRFPAAVESTVYFVVCEALSNVVKHARAGEAEVSVLEGGDGTLRVRVSDDGRGLGDAPSGSGLAGMRDRVRALGGDLQIGDTPGPGTTLVVTLPCG